MYDLGLADVATRWWRLLRDGGTQEGELLAYALDPEAMYGRGTRDCSNWALAEGLLEGPPPPSASRPLVREP